MYSLVAELTRKRQGFRPDVVPTVAVEYAF
jgi:hypothetical protein